MRGAEWLADETKLRATSPSGSRRTSSRQAVHLALIYPNSYYIGMSSLGYQVLYQTLNERVDVVCERAFLPEDDSVPISLETGRFLSQFDILGFSLSFEFDYFNLLRFLKSANLAVLAAERDERAPLVLAGGIAVTSNPEPLADFVDVFVLGEAEHAIQALISEYQDARDASATRSELLLRLAHLDGIYVPHLYKVGYTDEGKVAHVTPRTGAPSSVQAALTPEIDSLETCSAILTPHTEFANTHLIEIARGCGRHCRFCLADYAHRWPRRRSLESVLKLAEHALGHTDRIGLVGSSVSDHPQIDAIAQGLVERGFRISVASLRAESVRPPLLDALAASDQGTVTIAPEVATPHLQQVINKQISLERINYVFEEALKRDIRNLRLYFLIGVPEETEADVEAIVEMARQLRQIMMPYARRSGKSARIKFVISPLVPKPHTPFQWIPMEVPKSLSTKLRYLQKHLGMVGGVEMTSASARLAEMEGVLARGDRRLGPVLRAVALDGMPWKQALRRAGLSAQFYAQRTRDFDEMLPWSHLDLGVRESYLQREYTRHQQGVFTPPCDVGACHRCGACHDD